MTVESFIHQGVAFPTVEIEHFACSCDFHTAFCCIDITGAEWTDDSDHEWRLCAVCVDLYEHYQEVGVCCPKDPAVHRG
ncbi:hypothetical protein [Glycomyces tenuis]|uniref:hypothetical protein n=1 Tax=Glycomyces tenuis TaxID=58116 RepID=UPI0003FBBEA2|nr:hypothetical protein [Glycomyces tenuis]